MGFSERVYRIARKIPAGRVTTYGEIAGALGMKLIASRAVGNALHRNPYSPKVPCHRVVKSDGSIGGFAKGKKLKVKMLKSENVFVKKGKIVNFGKLLLKLR